MQHVDGVADVRDVNHTKRTTRVANAYFTRAAANGIHGLPVVWVKAALHAPQLPPGFLTRLFRKLPQICECATAKLQWFGTSEIIQNFI